MAVLTKDDETLLDSRGEVLHTLPALGCFGESVIIGLRRPATHVASAWTETLVVDRHDLVTVFSNRPQSSAKVVTQIFASGFRRQRLKVPSAAARLSSRVRRPPSARRLASASSRLHSNGRRC